MEVLRNAQIEYQIIQKIALPNLTCPYHFVATEVFYAQALECVKLGCSAGYMGSLQKGEAMNHKIQVMKKYHGAVSTCLQNLGIDSGWSPNEGVSLMGDVESMLDRHRYRLR